jgi:hypothetical protein
MTMSRRDTPTWFAARPTPGAAYMVSIMSSMSCCNGASIVSIGVVALRSTSSPYLRMGRMATVRVHPFFFRLSIIASTVCCARFL